MIRGGKTGKGNAYLKGEIGEVEVVAASTDKLVGERYGRVVKRGGKRKELVEVAS